MSEEKKEQEQNFSPQEPENLAADLAGAADKGEPAAEGIAELSELDQALLEVTELKDKLARAQADNYNLQQEYNGYVKRAKQENLRYQEIGVQKVLESLLGVLDNAELARVHGDLQGPAGAVVEELENTLKTNFQLERYGQAGDEFDPQLHEALMHQTSAEVEKEEIAQLMQPGYRTGEKVLRPARVGVVSPE
ncbi:MAG: nucleotide exchange factor GrpE [Actinomycetaceae bacterium]|nr:nucleotide exchange factor GrpE [Actinomycetaceae bacterium]